MLGAVLIDNHMINRVIPIVRAEDFYRPSHRAIFGAMQRLSASAVAIDPVTLGDALEKDGALEAVGGLGYIATLLDGVPSLVNAEHHARIVKEKAILRRLIEEAARIQTLASRDEESAETVLDEAEKGIREIGEDRTRTGFVSLAEIGEEAWDKIEKTAGREELITGVPTGFAELDELTSGLQPAELIVLAARPSMGKTALALNIAEHAALMHHKSVGVFSLEMAREQLYFRMLGSHAGVDLHRLRIGRISREEWARMSMAFKELGEARMFIDDTAGLGIMEMRAKARRLREERGLDLLVLDYLQLMRGRGRYESRQQEISDISRSLKELAKELRIPILALSQLSRAPETRAEDRHRPRLSDLRESGAIEQDADVVLFIYRPEVYFPRDESKRGQAEVIIGKQRNGPIDTVRLVFLRQHTKFVNASFAEESEG